MRWPQGITRSTHLSKPMVEVALYPLRSAAPRRSRSSLLCKHEILSDHTQVVAYNDMIVRPSDDLPIQCPQRQPNLPSPRDVRASVLLHVLLHLGNLFEGGDVPIVKPDDLRPVSIVLR
jgi:hypothetical protein